MTEDDEQGDESYSFCPFCKSDMFLTDEAVIEIKPIVKPVYKNDKPFDIEKWHQDNEDRERREDRAILMYQEAHEKLGPDAAEEIYFKIHAAAQ